MTESEHLDLQMVQERQDALQALYTAHLARVTSPGSSAGNSAAEQNGQGKEPAQS